MSSRLAFLGARTQWFSHTHSTAGSSSKKGSRDERLDSSKKSSNCSLPAARPGFSAPPRGRAPTFLHPNHLLTLVKSNKPGGRAADRRYPPG